MQCGSPVQKIVFGINFTDRSLGEGFVLSEQRTSGAGKSKHIKANSIYPAGNRCMKRHLFGMCQYINHVYKQVVNRE
jgi:hypothetical protein